MKVRVLKLKSVNSKLCGSRSFRGSLVIYDSNNNVMYCYVCRKAGSATCIADKTEFIDGKKFIRESLVYYNKSLKHEKCFNVVSEKKNIPQLSTFFYPAISTFAVQIYYTNKFLLYSY
jgi:small nuclear ribonucleoprotein (snRNP)-like protein